MAVKLRRPIEIPDGDVPHEFPRPITIRPLEVAGVVITKLALLEAMRIYLPALIDLEVVEDGERFVLTLAPPVNSVEQSPVAGGE